MSRAGRSLLVAVLVALGLAGGAAAQTMAAGSVAVLRGLDKLSGSTTDLEIPVGGAASFGRLRIALTACRYPFDDPAADAIAFLDIQDTRNGASLFRGWMIATAPALNALDDARFDVWVLSCR